MSEEEPVWINTVDHGRFECRVERTGSRTGTLIVKEVENDEEIFREDVALSYGAIFGPDVDDLTSWMNRCISEIDDWIGEKDG